MNSKKISLLAVITWGSFILWTATGISLYRRYGETLEETRKVDEIINIPIYEKHHYRVFFSDIPLGVVQIKIIPQKQQDEDAFLLDCTAEFAVSYAGSRYDSNVRGFLLCDLKGVPSIFNFTVESDETRLNVVGKVQGDTIKILFKTGEAVQNVFVPFDASLQGMLAAFLKERGNASPFESLVRVLSAKFRIEKVDPGKAGSIEKKFPSVDELIPEKGEFVEQF